ncbi:MAG: ATP-binding domain-containing protein [Methylacidiphilales bacterium]|nr:ATP-binding domain-containing protein [Candidatus Methylacidiphilales bacterium]
MICHKAQGSQFQRVIVPVFMSRLLDRTLLYTAITRAQEQVVLVGDRETYAAAVAAPPMPSRRVTGIGFHLGLTKTSV